MTVVTLNTCPQWPQEAHQRAVREPRSTNDEHRGKKIVVRATNVSLRRSNGVHYETIGHWCPVCGFQLRDRGKRLLVEALKGLMGVRTGTCL